MGFEKIGDETSVNVGFWDKVSDDLDDLAAGVVRAARRVEESVERNFGHEPAEIVRGVDRTIFETAAFFRDASNYLVMSDKNYVPSLEDNYVTRAIDLSMGMVQGLADTVNPFKLRTTEEMAHDISVLLMMLVPFALKPKGPIEAPVVKPQYQVGALGSLVEDLAKPFDAIRNLEARLNEKLLAQGRAPLAAGFAETPFKSPTALADLAKRLSYVEDGAKDPRLAAKASGDKSLLDQSVRAAKQALEVARSDQEGKGWLGCMVGRLVVSKKLLEAAKAIKKAESRLANAQDRAFAPADPVGIFVDEKWKAFGTEDECRTIIDNGHQSKAASVNRSGPMNEWDGIVYRSSGDILVVDLEALGGDFSFHVGRVSSPKAPGSELIISDPKISRLHAELRYDPLTRRLVVNDSSANGTWVNGVKVRGEFGYEIPQGSDGVIVNFAGTSVYLKTGIVKDALKPDVVERSADLHPRQLDAPVDLRVVARRAAGQIEKNQNVESVSFGVYGNDLRFVISPRGRISSEIVVQIPQGITEPNLIAEMVDRVLNGGIGNYRYARVNVEFRAGGDVPTAMLGANKPAGRGGLKTSVAMDGGDGVFGRLMPEDVNPDNPPSVQIIVPLDANNAPIGLDGILHALGLRLRKFGVTL